MVLFRPTDNLSLTLQKPPFSNTLRDSKKLLLPLQKNMQHILQNKLKLSDMGHCLVKSGLRRLTEPGSRGVQK